MAFKARTVVAFILLSMFASSLMTLTLMDGSLLASKQEEEVLDTGTLTTREINKMATAFNLIEQKYVKPIDRKKIVDGAIQGMISSLDDPYSAYMDQEEAQQFSENVQGSFSGIGAEVTMIDGRVTVIAPIKGSPAEKAGIHAKDIIVSVDSNKLDGMKLTEALEKIRGPKGTKAKFMILRAGATTPTEITIVRDNIDVETVYSEMLEGKVGKIEIRQFTQHTADRFLADLASLEAKGMKGLIIDVRNDPGGILPVVINIAQPFIPSGKPIVQVEDRNQSRQSTLSKGTGKKYPIVVLINKGSASASEILAAAIKEGAGGKIIGETSFGKGTVQISYGDELGDGSILKMTIAKWLTPNGNWIHEKGVKPDIAVSQPEFYKVSPLTKASTLKFDDSGEDVKNAQIMLEGLGFDAGRKDGYYNDQTKKAVTAFQKKHGLKANGSIDVLTAGKIEAEVIEEMRKPERDLQLKAALKYVQDKIQ